MKKILYFLSFVFVALFTACSEGDDFDIDYNAQKYLIETRCSGALVKPFSAIVVESFVAP